MRTRKTVKGGAEPLPSSQVNLPAGKFKRYFQLTEPRTLEDKEIAAARRRLQIAAKIAKQENEEMGHRRD